MTWREVFEGLAALPVALKHLRELHAVGTVKVATIGPNDAIVIETDAKLTHEGRENISKAARKIWPDVKVIILDSGFRMSVVHNERTR